MPPTFSVFPIDLSPGYVLYRTVTKIKSELAKAFQAEGYDVTPEQWVILSRLWEQEGINQSALAESVSKDRHNVARILHLMRKNGLVTSLSDAQDKRCQRVFLTDKGREIKSALIAIVMKHLRRCFRGLTQEDFDQLMGMHRKIMENLCSAGTRNRSAGLEAALSPAASEGETHLPL
jgi:MarR family transcriptional regulator, organic hydroperoxide resistance regulator